MKTIIAFLILASSLSMVGCRTKAYEDLRKILFIVDDLHSSNAIVNFFEGAGYVMPTTSSRIDFFKALEHYHPVNGDNRVVFRIQDDDGLTEQPCCQGHNFYGLDMSGAKDLLASLVGKTDPDKIDLLDTFFQNARIEELERFGIGDDAFFCWKEQWKCLLTDSFL